MARGDGFDSPESFISPHTEYGLLRSTDPMRTVWLWAEIPMELPLLDGASDMQRVNAAHQFGVFFEGLASQVTVSGMRYRSLLKSQYRRFHLLACSFPRQYEPPRVMQGSALGRWQEEAYRRMTVQDSCAFIGVPLYTGGDPLMHGNHKPRLMRRIMRSIDRMAYGLQNGAAQFEEYLTDAKEIEQVMLRAGFLPFTQMYETDPGRFERNVARMKSWWCLSASNALPVMAETDHMHLFPDTLSAASAQNMFDDDIPCSQWHIPRSYPASVCFAQSSDFDSNSLSDPGNLWAGRLLEVATGGGANAVGVSVRATVEPSKITESEIRRNDRAVNETMRERWSKGQEATGDMEDAAENLDLQKSVYRHRDVPPTLTDLSVAVLAAGSDDQPAKSAVQSLGVVPGIDFVDMSTGYEQLMGFKSMCPCSPVTYTPYQMHWSSNMLAGAGVASMAKGGDPQGALLGFTEANRQPVYIGTTTVQDEDRKPFFVIIGDTGTGKSMALVSLFAQWSMIPSRSGGGNTPCVLINPKQGNDFEDAVRALGGDVRRMDSDMADGTFDPLNVLDEPEQAKNMATIMLASILNPEGGADFETSIAAMLTYGIRHGARCCGIALRMAWEAWHEQREDALDLPRETGVVWDSIRRGLSSYRMLRLIIGTSDSLEPLRVSQNLTLINAGEQNLVPDDKGGRTVTGRIQSWVLRMAVLGAGAAVRGRDGMVGLDEAWVAMGGDKGAGSTLEQWARLARSQRFTPVLASQKVQEFIDAGLVGGISRALLLALDNPPERDGTVSPAKQALRLLQIDDAGGRILGRMTQDPVLGNGEPNYASLKVIRTAVRDPAHPGVARQRVVRGSVGYFVDLKNPPLPVEVSVSPRLLEQISTTATDVLAREAAKRGNGNNGKD